MTPLIRDLLRSRTATHCRANAVHIMSVAILHPFSVSGKSTPAILQNDI